MHYNVQLITSHDKAPLEPKRGLLLFIYWEAVPAATQRILAQEVSASNLLCGLFTDQLLFALTSLPCCTETVLGFAVSLLKHALGWLKSHQLDLYAKKWCPLFPSLFLRPFRAKTNHFLRTSHIFLCVHFSWKTLLCHAFALWGYCVTNRLLQIKERLECPCNASPGPLSILTFKRPRGKGILSRFIQISIGL